MAKNNKAKKIKTKEIKTIGTELNRIQKELKVPKKEYNKFSNFYYRTAEGILEAYKKVAQKTILTINDDVVIIGDRYYIKATAKLIFGEQSISTTAYAREPSNKKGMDEAQITGATSSYARKYALNALFAIDDSKDADYSPSKNVHKEDKFEKAKRMVKASRNPDGLIQYAGKLTKSTFTTQQKKELNQLISTRVDELQK